MNYSFTHKKILHLVEGQVKSRGQVQSSKTKVWMRGVWSVFFKSRVSNVNGLSRISPSHHFIMVHAEFILLNDDFKTPLRSLEIVI